MLTGMSLLATSALIIEMYTTCPMNNMRPAKTRLEGHWVNDPGNDALFILMTIISVQGVPSDRGPGSD